MVDILENRKVDNSVFPLLFCLDEGDDWQDKKIWTKSNPNLGVTPYISYMDDQYQKALNEGAAKANTIHDKESKCMDNYLQCLDFQ
jgi:phage terminase large subunit-like protein